MQTGSDENSIKIISSTGIIVFEQTAENNFQKCSTTLLNYRQACGATLRAFPRNSFDCGYRLTGKIGIRWYLSDKSTITGASCGRMWSTRYIYIFGYLDILFFLETIGPTKNKNARTIFF